MGTTTPNIGLYIPSDGETNYGTSFANGMLNLDTHDHSGPPNKGVPLSAAGIANGAITANKLNANVFGLGVHPDANNAIEVDGVLLPIFQLAVNGFIARTSGSTAAARTITGTANQITVTNGDGVAGNPVLSFPTTFIDSADFTPTLTSSAGLGVITYSTQQGRYQRIGSWIMFDLSLEFSVAAGSAGGTLRVSSLPFASVGSNYWTAGYWADGTNQDTVSYVVQPGNTYFDIFLNSTLATQDVSVAGAFSRNLQFTGLYRIA